MVKMVFANKKGSDSDAPLSEALAPWHVLIVDDDPEVHSVTELALRNVAFDGRRLAFSHAYSGAEAERLIARDNSIALILLDVVMETDDAGLRFVEFVRQEVRNQKVRIVLRTGQPGQAPEADVILRYDINDYKAKTELTQQRLFTTIITALRGFRDISAIEASREGLQKIIEASSSLMQSRSLKIFASGVLTQLGSLMGTMAGGLLCTQSRDHGLGPQVIAASGRFDSMLDDDATAIDPMVRERIEVALAARQTITRGDHTLLYLRTPNARDMVVYIESDRPFDAVSRQLVEVFGANISVGFDNLEMFEELIRTNEDLHTRVEERTRDLHERESRLRAILEASPIGVALVRLADGRPVFANSRLVQLFSLAPGSLSATASVPERLKIDSWKEIVTTLQQRGMVNDVEMEIRQPDGSTAWGLLSARAMTVDDEAVALIWIYDITPRKLLEQELTLHATTDHLTGVANRRHFLTQAQSELERTQRYGRPLALLMLDIDHFKKINDTYGHEVGDRVIRLASATCTSVLRAHDITGRIGGEEFAALLLETDRDRALQAAERIREASEAQAVTLDDGREVRFTVSVGVAIVSATEKTIDEAMVRADGALYASKRAGRNKVSFSDS